MSRLIPNAGPPGSDCCLQPVELVVPVVIVDNGNDCFWYPEPMDPAAADRLAFAIAHGDIADVHCVNIPLILPSAHEVRAAVQDLGQLQSDLVRVQLRAG